MNTLEPGPDERFHRSGRLSFATSALSSLVYVLRVVIFAPLAIFEPVIRIVLAGTSVVGLTACLFYKIAERPGVHHHVPYAGMIIISLAAAVLLVLYYKLMRWLAP